MSTKVKVRNPLPGSGCYTSLARAERLVGAGAAQFIENGELEFLDKAARQRADEQALRVRLRSVGYRLSPPLSKRPKRPSVFGWRAGVWRGLRPGYAGVTAGVVTDGAADCPRSPIRDGSIDPRSVKPRPFFFQKKGS